MEMTFTPEQLAFRDEVRAWIAQAMPPHIAKKAREGVPYYSQSETMDWQPGAGREGLGRASLARSVRGTGWDVTQRYLFGQELVRANVPTLSPFGVSMVGPLLIQYGDDAQKQRFLPKILAGEEVWCQGYSEPNAGSDLANLQLPGRQGRRRHVLNGQKTWTTYAQYADWIFVLARTNSEGKKQEGITFLLADLRNTPGITVKPSSPPAGPMRSPRPGSRMRGYPRRTGSGPRTAAGPWPRRWLGHERTLIEAWPSRASGSRY